MTEDSKSYLLVYTFIITHIHAHKERKKKKGRERRVEGGMGRGGAEK